VGPRPLSFGEVAPGMLPAGGVVPGAPAPVPVNGGASGPSVAASERPQWGVSARERARVDEHERRFTLPSLIECARPGHPLLAALHARQNCVAVLSSQSESMNRPIYSMSSAGIGLGQYAGGICRAA